MPSELRDKSSRPRDGDAASTTAARTKAASARDKPRDQRPSGPMDKWVEPAIATKASYEDHHAAPYGVLEHMQPLGERPSSKVRARTKVAEGSRKAVLARLTANTAGLGIQGTPEGTPQPPALARVKDESAPVRTDTEDDREGDEDYAPHPPANGKTKEQRTTRARTVKRQLHREPSGSAVASSSKADVNSLKADVKPSKADVKPSKVDVKPSKADAKASSTVQDSSKLTYTGGKLKRIVEEAKRRAIAAGKMDLAAAVNEIYLQSKNSSRLAQLLEAILQKVSTAEERTEFHTYVHQARKKLRAEQKRTEEQGGNKAPAAAQEANGAHARPHIPAAAAVEITSPQSTRQQPQPAASTPIVGVSDKPRQKLAIKVNSPSHSRSERTPRKSPSSRTKTRPHYLMKDESDLSELTDFEGSDIMKSARKTPQRAAGSRRAAPLPADKAPKSRSSRQQSVLPDSSREASTAAAATAVAENGEPASSSSVSQPSGTAGAKSPRKRSPDEAELEMEANERELNHKKQKLSQGTDQFPKYFEFPESSTRSSLSRIPTSGRTLRGSVRDTLGRPGGGLSGPARSTPAPDASSDLDSPLSSPGSSRRSTPPELKSKPPGKRAKTKQSPEKKHAQGHGGLTGVGGAGGRDSPIGDDDNEELSDNNDYCSACRGSGYLLCCDGCDRSFHLTCVDPPLSQFASELNEPWFCNICVAKRPMTTERPEKPVHGLFAPLLNSLAKRNPSTFALPPSIRDFFEGVGADKNGAFVETIRTKKSRTGHGEKPDDFKLKDAKGSWVLCCHCRRASGGTRPIIQCDDCGQSWHLDCLDPPLAIAPGRDAFGNKVGDWMCPAHTDHDLRRVETKLLYGQRPGRRIHVRKPRAADVVSTSLTRGLRNTGLIEILDDDDDESESEFYFEEDQRDDTVIYKLPASGIKLDFIAKVKQQRAFDRLSEPPSKRRRLQPDKPAAPAAKPERTLSQPNFTERPIREQQAALNLTQFAKANDDLDLGGDRIENLTAALIAEAPTDVVESEPAVTPAKPAERVDSAKMAELSETADNAMNGQNGDSAENGETADDGETAETTVASAPTQAVKPSSRAANKAKQQSPLSKEERADLLLLQELIRRRLEGSTD